MLSDGASCLDVECVTIFHCPRRSLAASALGTCGKDDSVSNAYPGISGYNYFFSKLELSTLYHGTSRLPPAVATSLQRSDAVGNIVAAF